MDPYRIRCFTFVKAAAVDHQAYLTGFQVFTVNIVCLIILENTLLDHRTGITVVYQKPCCCIGTEFTICKSSFRTANKDNPIMFVFQSVFVNVTIGHCHIAHKGCTKTMASIIVKLTICNRRCTILYGNTTFTVTIQLGTGNIENRFLIYAYSMSQSLLWITRTIIQDLAAVSRNLALTRQPDTNAGTLGNGYIFQVCSRCT